MQLLITFKGLDTPPGKQNAEVVTHNFQQLIQRFLSSGILVASGVFADAPGGFMIVEVDSNEDLTSLLGLGQADNFYVTVNHLMPFQGLVEHLELWSEAEQSYGLYGKSAW